jgi:hypothetical protein
MRRFRLLTICGDDSDATSFYRGLGPLSVLERQVPWLDVLRFWTPFECNENRLRTVDGVFIQRPSIAPHLDIVRSAKLLGVPVWIDLDDDIFSIPDDNPTQQLYSMNNYAHFAAECMKLADVVTVSTEALKTAFSRFSTNIQVIPNAFDDYFFSKWKRERDPARGKPVVLWRGSNSHDYDLLKIVGSVRPYAEKHPEWHWVFLGHKPWVLTQDLPKEKWNHVGWNSSVAGYLNTLNRIQPTIVIVPLVDHGFNRCKSNIAWIEGTFANAAVIAPRWESWDRPGVVRYDSASDFSKTLHDCLAGGVDLKWHVTESWKDIRENLVLTKVNRKRFEILRSFEQRQGAVLL